MGFVEREGVTVIADAGRVLFLAVLKEAWLRLVFLGINFYADEVDLLLIEKSPY
jgi:hypothetical protein